MGKLVGNVVKPDILDAVGPLQTCVGFKGDIEASIHVTREMWEEPETEGVLLVDADNAFNRVNRELAVHNIRETCPPFHKYLSNTYQKPARLVVNDGYTTDYLFSMEGCTQGDVAAMAFYTLAVQPLTSELADVASNIGNCRQVWYADDSMSAGKLMSIRHWWDALCEKGPDYGYYPKPSKTILIIKSREML